jgi:hypothetical protein
VLRRVQLAPKIIDGVKTLITLEEELEASASTS